MSFHQEGKEFLVQTGLTDVLIASFIKHSEPATITQYTGPFLVSLLEAFANLTTARDLGITPLLGQNAVIYFSQFFESSPSSVHPKLLPQDHLSICRVALRVLGNMSLNGQAREELIENNVI